VIHVVLLLNVISLVVGSWGALYSHQMYRRFRLQLFRSYTLFIIFFNVIILLTLIYIYIIVNLLGEGPETQNTLLVVSAHIFDFFFEIGMIFHFLRLVTALKNRSLSRRFGRIYIAAVLCLAFLFGAGIAVFLVSGSAELIQVITSATFLAAMIVFVLYLIGLVSHKPDKGSRMPLAVSRAFGLFYLAGFLLFILIALFPKDVRMLGVSIVYLLMNIWPLVWINAVYMPAVRRDQLLLTDDDAVGRIAEDYALSNREREILGLLLQGKTYKDIEAALFISINTVRNHVHNLYKKTGVGSRSRLVHLALEMKSEGKGSLSN
jgi:DNA-binding CsgD family transcriptional regulator